MEEERGATGDIGRATEQHEIVRREIDDVRRELDELAGLEKPGPMRDVKNSPWAFLLQYARKD